MYNRRESAYLDFVENEKRIKQFWDDNHIFQKSIEQSKDKEPFVFYDGPPTANGKPHIGHVLTRVIKDMIPRYQTMKGKMVPRKAGWDTHGLPVELEVEKLLGIKDKEQIEEYGLEPFIKQCKKSVWKYQGMWEDFSKTVGFWADMDDPYVTYDNNFIESEWWALKQIWEKDLLYKGFKIVPYCPRCGTPLSSHEVAQGYKDVKEHSAIVKFKLKEEDAYFLVWTTTPWTLPSNVALCINPNEQYVKVKSKGEVYYLAENLCSSVLGEEYEVLETFTGKALEYTEYEPLFAFVNPKEKAWFVTCDTYVTLDTGTGVVHIAPAFGEDDANVGRQYNLPFVQLVDLKGEMTAETSWPGVFCKDADKEIIKELKEKGLLFSTPLFEHSYPFCWRCDTPLIYYARDSWFIKMTAVKDDLIRNNNTINWIPPNIGTGRFGDWLENVQDWGISRNRYWGAPLNIWECSCGHRHAIGSIEELKSMSSNCPDDIELHRPYIDAVLLDCPVCGKEMKRVPEVIDCWFDSGSMPFAQHHYPFENKELFEQQFPADFISEAVDQTRGWFYSLLAISTLIFNKAPYKNVIVLGHVQDENGQKMSKSKGNAVDPFEALETYGADAIRWYFYTNSAPWLPNSFNGKMVVEGQRKFINTLWNTYSFFALYADIDQFDVTKYSFRKDALTIMDQWLLSKVNTLIKEVDTNLGNYCIPEAARAIQAFVEEMSNWYVRCCRERFWAQDISDDKINAYLTLYTSLVTVCKLAAPMVPFITEDIYQNLVCSIDSSAPKSIHLCSFPIADEALIMPELEKDMEEVLQVVTIGRAARNGANIKIRQPLSEMNVKADALESEFVEIIKKELNVKSVQFIEDISSFLSYKFKPNLVTVGPKFGKKIGEIRTLLPNIDGNAAKKELDTNGFLTLTLSDSTVELQKEDLLIEAVSQDNFYSLTDNDITVILNIALTPELRTEGYVREIISKIQTMRKNAGFEVMDYIHVYVSGNEKIMGIMQAFATEIQTDVLAKEIKSGTIQDHSQEWDINGETVVFGVEKVKG